MTARQATIIGLDLAWSARNGTGAVVLRPARDGTLVPDSSCILGGDAEILDYVEQASAGARLVVAAIDAPIIAPNAPGRGRPVDREVSRLYGRFGAGAYPANRIRCARPIGLAATLADRGWSLDPWALRDRLQRDRSKLDGRYALEVYPHAAMVGLFRLPQIVRYKKGRVATRRAGLSRLQKLLHERLPALDPGVRPLPYEDAQALRGRGLKGLEDRLDAVVCAAMAARFLREPDACSLPGSMEHGYILVPRVPE